MSTRPAKTAADGKALLHEATDQHHLVVLPKPPRTRQHPDDAAEFFAHVSNPETGIRELNIALPPGWMSMQLDKLIGEHKPPGRIVDKALRAWSCWNGLQDGTQSVCVVFAFDIDTAGRLTLADDEEESSPAAVQS